MENFIYILIRLFRKNTRDFVKFISFTKHLGFNKNSREFTNHVFFCSASCLKNYPGLSLSLYFSHIVATCRWLMLPKHPGPPQPPFPLIDVFSDTSFTDVKTLAGWLQKYSLYIFAKFLWVSWSISQSIRLKLIFAILRNIIQVSLQFLNV